jgi:hypothetical protein
VVLSVDLFTVPRSPTDVMPMPFEWVRVLSTVTPSLLVLCWLLLELEPPYTGAGAAVVDWVDVVLEEVCAAATPVIIARAAAAARYDLIMWYPPRN